MKSYPLNLGGILVMLVALLLVWQVVLARTVVYNLSWNTLAGGGAASGGAYSLDSAIGQPVAGQMDHLAYSLCAGFLCGVQAETRVYLPLVRK